MHTTYTYDANQQMDSLKVTKGTSVLLEEKIGYDVLGLLQTVTSTTGNKTFSYDKGNQLLSQDIPAAQLSETYTYDATGNRASRTTTKNGVTKHTAYTYNGNNELKAVNDEPYTYDDNGNRTLDSRYSYTYNKFDQLTSVTDRKTGALTATYTYDDAGRRTSKTVGGKVTNYHYGDGIQVLFETDAAGTITAEYIYDPDGLPLVLSKGTQNYYYVYNSLKEIVGLTDRDGNFVATYSYDAWGNILSQSGSLATDNPYRYKGVRYDDETGLYYLIARYYQPEEGVFLSADPEGGDLDLAITQNGYNYANNNPVMMTDADGNFAWLVINAGFAAYDGYTAYKSGKSVAGIAAASAVGFIGGGKGKAVKKGIGLIKKHGNSLLSKKNNHGYEIFTKSNGVKNVVKVGISGGKINRNGVSQRANSQVNRWNKSGNTVYHTRIVRKNMTRKKALKWEQGHVNRVYKAGATLKMHKRPSPKQ